MGIGTAVVEIFNSGNTGDFVIELAVFGTGSTFTDSVVVSSVADTGSVSVVKEDSVRVLFGTDV